jgi:prephenate dehydratase
VSPITTYAYLGPAGTFTEAALRQIANDSDVLVPYSNVTAALDAVRDGKAEKVLVPIENSVEGVVSRTLDELAVGTPLVVTAETTLPVSFALMVLPENIDKPITKIATHPHAEAQCRSYIAKNYPQAEVVEMASTAGAAKGLKDGNYDAAIASEIAAKNYGLKVLASDIGDNTGAVTRFVVAQKPGETPAANRK